MNEKGRQTKLLAAVAVFAMVVCALAVVTPGVSAADEENTYLAAADDYTYSGDNSYTYNGTRTIDGTGVWMTYSADSIDLTNMVDVRNDFTRFMGALHYNETATVDSIIFNGVTYTWDASEPNHGSNWYNGSTSLVSAAGTYMLNNMATLANTHAIPMTLVTENGNVGITYGIDGYVAAVGSIIYKTLDAAVKAAQDGATVEIISDIESTNRITIDKNLTIDGNENTFRGKFYLDAEADNGEELYNITIQNLSMIGPGTDNSNDFGIHGQNQGTNDATDSPDVRPVNLTLLNVDISGYGGKGVYLTNVQTLVVDGCSFDDNATTSDTGGTPAIRGDYAFDLNLCGVTDVEITISNSTFGGDCGNNGPIKITQRGGESVDGSYPTDDYRDDIHTDTPTTIKSVVIENCKFDVANKMADVLIGTAPGANGEWAQITYTQAFESLQIIPAEGEYGDLTVAFRGAGSSTANSIVFNLPAGDGNSVALEMTGTIVPATAEKKITGQVTVDLASGVTVASGSVPEYMKVTYGEKNVENVKDSISDNQASSGNVLIINGSIDASKNVSLTSGTQLMIVEGATYSGNIALDADSSITNNGGTYEGTVTIGTGTSTNTAIFDNVQGTFTVSEGSVYIDGVLQSGTITVTGDVVLSGSVDGDSSDVVIVGSGTANVTVAAGFSVSSGMSIEFRNVSVSSEGPITNEGTVIFTNSTINGTMTVTGGTVSGGVTSGTLILNGSINFSTAFNLGENARMTVNQGASIIGNFTNNGTVNLYGTIDTTSLENNGTINVLGDGEVNVTPTGNGTINYSSVSSEATLSGELKTRPTFGADQIVTVTDDLTLVSGARLTIEGTLIIPEGVTVTVQDGAQIILSGQSAIMQNSGTIVVQSATSNGGIVLKNGSKVTNNGTVTASYEDETGEAVSNVAINVGEDSTFTNNGTITIAAGSELNVSGSIVNAADAIFTVNGEISATSISNSGTITINGTISGTTTISLVAADASVEVVSVQGGSLTINDNGLKVGTTTLSGNDSVTINPNSDYAVRGITVTAVTSTSNNVTTKALSVSGETSYGYVGELTTAPDVSGNVATMTFAGSISVSETFTVTNHIGVTSNGTLTVTGAMSVYGLTNGGTVTVTGTLDVIGSPISGGTVNAAMYMTEEVGTTTVRTYHYTTLANAIDAGATSITVTGEIEVDTEVTIPSGTTVTLNGDMTITEDGYVTVANGGRITGTGDIAVEGSLYITVVSTGLRGYTGVITSEVYSTDETDALYTNLVSAMAAAESGDTIELNGDADLELTTFTIKDGVILDTNNHILTLNGSTLVIDGTLEVDAANQLVLETYNYPAPSTVEVESSVVLNGYIRSQAALSYGETYPAGAYYSILEDGVPMNYITTVENSATVIGNTVGQTVTVYGDVTVGNVEFTGTADAPATVIVRGEMEAGTVTLDYATLRIGTSAAMFSGTVTDGNGTIAISDAAYSEGAAFAVSVVNGAERLTVSGQISDADQEDPASVVVTGTVYVNGLNISNMTVDGTVETSGSLTVTEVLTINGTVNVNSGNSLTVNASGSKVYVLGDLNVAESTTTASAGTATVATLYIGVDADMATSEATVSGNVQISSTGTAYVSAGSTAPASITGATNVRNTAFYVEDNLFLTAYGFNGSIADMSDISVEDADFVGWDDADGETRYYVLPNEGQANANSIPVGTYPVLYANIDYTIYTVTVYTDGGIGSVAIDGVLLMNEGGNTFETASPIAAGTHTLTYTLKSGFEGTATMTIDGQQISGNEFTISGDYNGTDTVVINLAGTTPVTPGSGSGEIIVNVPDNSDDGMSLTDILLIVLVILILVMAIIVALRLMRS